MEEPSAPVSHLAPARPFNRAGLVALGERLRNRGAGDGLAAQPRLVTAAIEARSAGARKPRTAPRGVPLAWRIAVGAGIVICLLLLAARWLRPDWTNALAGLHPGAPAAANAALPAAATR